MDHDLRGIHFHPQIVVDLLGSLQEVEAGHAGLVQTSSSAAARHIHGAHAGGYRDAPAQGLGALVVVLVSGEYQLHAMPFQDRHELLARGKIDGIVQVLRNRIRSLVKIGNAPIRLALCQIVVQPCQHAGARRGVARIQKVRVQGDEVSAAPIEGVIAAQVCWRNRFGWRRMQGQIGRRAGGIVLVIARRRKKTGPAHHGEIVSEVVGGELLECAGLVGDIPDVEHEIKTLRFLEHLVEDIPLTGGAGPAIPEDQETVRARTRGMECILASRRHVVGAHVDTIGVRGSRIQTRQLRLILVKVDAHGGFRNREETNRRDRDLRETVVLRITDR